MHTHPQHNTTHTNASRAGLPAILEALAREHRVYEHTIYQPVAVAANEDDGVVFVGVAWEFKNTGPVFGANVASGRCGGCIAAAARV